MVSRCLITTIIRQRKKDIGEIDKIEKYSHLDVRVVYNCLCVFMCVFVKIIFVYYRVWNQPIGIMLRVFSNGPGDRVSMPGKVIAKTQKMVLDSSCLTFRILRHGTRVKWSNPWKGIAPSPTPRCVKFAARRMHHRTHIHTYYHLYEHTQKYANVIYIHIHTKRVVHHPKILLIVFFDCLNFSNIFLCLPDDCHYKAA